MDLELTQAEKPVGGFPWTSRLGHFRQRQVEVEHPAGVDLASQDEVEQARQVGAHRLGVPANRGTGSASQAKPASKENHSLTK